MSTRSLHLDALAAELQRLVDLVFERADGDPRIEQAGGADDLLDDERSAGGADVEFLRGEIGARDAQAGRAAEAPFIRGAISRLAGDGEGLVFLLADAVALVRDVARRCPRWSSSISNSAGVALT